MEASIVNQTKKKGPVGPRVSKRAANSISGANSTLNAPSTEDADGDGPVNKASRYSAAARAAVAKKLADTLDHIIIVQFGSRNLKIGLASDTSPITIPAVIAYRSISARSNASLSSSPSYEDPSVVFPSPINLSQSATFLAGNYSYIEARNRDCDRLLNIKRRDRHGDNEDDTSLSMTHPAAPPPQAQSWSWTWTNFSSSFEQQQRVICGDQALRLPPNAPYQLFSPIFRGNFNTGPSASVQMVLDSISHLLEHALKDRLKISSSEISTYSIGLVVPDSWTQFEIVSMYNLLMQSFGFASVFSHLESVLSCFGAGVSSGLVVDIGAEKTSICCVDDGLVLPKSRLHLSFGGDDVTEYLSWLFRKFEKIGSVAKPFFHNFSFKSMNLHHPQHFMLIDMVKQDMCFARSSSMTAKAFLEDYSIDQYLIQVSPSPSAPTEEHLLEASGALELACTVLFRPSILSPALIRACMPVSGDFISIEHSDYLSPQFLDSTVIGPLLSKKTGAQEVLRMLASGRKGLVDSAEVVVGAVSASSTAASPSPSRSSSPPPLPQTTIKGSATSSSSFKYSSDVAAVDYMYRDEPPLLASTLSSESLPAASVAQLLQGSTAAATSTSSSQTESSTQLRHLFGWSVDDQHNPKRSRAIGPDIRPYRHESSPDSSSGVLKSLGLVDAITASIASLPTDEMKRRFSESILLAGGSSKLRGLLECLEDELFEILPQKQSCVGNIEILQPPKIRCAGFHFDIDSEDADPAWLAWKGAALLIVSEPSNSSRDTWIDKREWSLHGPRILREKSPYLW